MKNIGFVLVLALCALPAAAQSWDWSEPGSTGVVGDGTASLGLYSFVGSTFGVAAGNIATVDARYPVTNTMGSLTDITPGWTTLKIAAHDQYAGGSVTATLYEVDKCASTQTQLCSVTSTDSDQDLACFSCTFAGPLDFANNTYYVYVSITNSATTEDPRLYSLAVY
ncbi:MAG: hypothetical protein ACJ74H_19375 [Thermoanaerobaculia bacterium]